MTAPPGSDCSDTASTTAFGPPFDDTDADIILRSSDQVKFMVYKVILSKASPVFKTMFSLPQPQPATDTSQDPRPIIDLAEDSRILAALLSVIYPHTFVTAEPLSLNDLISTLDLARKYDMATASRRLLLDFKDSKVVQDNLVEAFCAAYSRELGEAARIAARASLKHRLTLDDVGEKLQYTNGPAFHALWKFHRACSAAAVSAISDYNFTWLTPEQTTWWGPDSPYGCKCIRAQFTLGQHCVDWRVNLSWTDYIKQARNALGDHPCKEAVTRHEILRSFYQMPKCHECKMRIYGLSEFSFYLGEEVERRVSGVRGALTYSLDILTDLIFLGGPSDEFTFLTLDAPSPPSSFSLNLPLLPSPSLPHFPPNGVSFCFLPSCFVSRFWNLVVSFPLSASAPVRDERVSNAAPRLRRSAHLKGLPLPSPHDSNLSFISLGPSSPRLARSSAQQCPTPVPRAASTTPAASTPLVQRTSGSVQTASPAIVGLASSPVNAIGGIRLDLYSDLYSPCTLASRLPFTLHCDSLFLSFHATASSNVSTIRPLYIHIEMYNNPHSRLLPM